MAFWAPRYRCWIKRDRIKVVFLDYLKDNLFELIIAFSWLTSVIIESQGGRADSFEEPFMLKESVSSFLASLTGLNRMFYCGILCVIALAILVYGIRRWKQGDSLDETDKSYVCWFGRCISCIILAVLYLIVLCARVTPYYLNSANVKIGWMFYVVLFTMISMAYLLKRIPRFILVFPILIYILFFETVIDDKAYAENYVPTYDAETVKALNENIIQQVKAAEEAGEDSVAVLVPYTESQDWPIAVTYGGERIAYTLHNHGITKRKMNIHLIADPQINEQFGLQ